MAPFMYLEANHSHALCPCRFLLMRGSMYLEVRLVVDAWWKTRQALQVLCSHYYDCFPSEIMQMYCKFKRHLHFVKVVSTFQVLPS